MSVEHPLANTLSPPAEVEIKYPYLVIVPSTPPANWDQNAHESKPDLRPHVERLSFSSELNVPVATRHEETRISSNSGGVNQILTAIAVGVSGIFPRCCCQCKLTLAYTYRPRSSPPSSHRV